MKRTAQEKPFVVSKKPASPIETATSTAMERPVLEEVFVDDCENGIQLVDNWDTSCANDDSFTQSETRGGPEEPQIVVSIEVLLHPSSTLQENAVAPLVLKHLKKTIFGRSSGGEARHIIVKDLSRILSMSDTLKRHVREMSFEESEGQSTITLFGHKDAKWCFYVYKMGTQETSEDTLVGEDTPAATHRILPSLEYHHLWESLIYDSAIKKKLLKYAIGTVLFSKMNVDSNLVTWNKVVLLHGPPGTGKTSLCKALAQKLSIRMVEHYPCVYLIEINSHSLFSKWFSESGKLVTKMFQSIENIIQQKSAPLVCLLLDEVESLARARQDCVSANEPSDAVRAVNALLTQIDKIKQYPNVLILTTSNISEAIDLAFIDRADIKQYIGNPSPEARQAIFMSSLQELIKKGVLCSDPALISVEDNPIRLILKRISGSLSDGMSGRSLRKMPFLTHALQFSGKLGVGVKDFLEAMEVTIAEHQTGVQELNGQRKDHGD